MGAAFQLWAHTADTERQSELSAVSSGKGSDPTMGAPPSCNPHHLPEGSSHHHTGDGLQHVTMGETQPMVTAPTLAQRPEGGPRITGSLGAAGPAG